MNIYQSNTYRKNLSWLNFYDQSRASERQHVKDQQPCITAFVVFQHIRITGRSTRPDVTTVFHVRAYGRFIEIHSNLRRKNIYKTNQGSNFLGYSFSNSDNVQALIQFRRETQPRNLRRSFSLKNRRPIHFSHQLHSCC